MSRELAEALIVTAEVCGTDFSEGAATLIAEELAAYDRDQVMGALRRCRREVKGRLTMAAILERMDDGRPGAEEAWAMMPMDERQSVVWTQEMATAFGVCGPMLARGDKVGARMAFKERYAALVADARDAKRPVTWNASLGHDPRGREGVLAQAITMQRLAKNDAMALGYCGDESQDMMALEHVKAALEGIGK